MKKSMLVMNTPSTSGIVSWHESATHLKSRLPVIAVITFADNDLTDEKVSPKTSTCILTRSIPEKPPNVEMYSVLIRSYVIAGRVQPCGRIKGYTRVETAAATAGFPVNVEYTSVSRTAISDSIHLSRLLSLPGLLR